MATALLLILFVVCCSNLEVGQPTHPSMRMHLVSTSPLAVSVEFTVGVESGAIAVDLSSVKLFTSADVVKAGTRFRIENQPLELDYKVSPVFTWPDSLGRITGIVRFIATARDSTGYFLGDTLDIDMD